MNVHGVGLATPRMVHSCTIKNNSYGNIRVHILYKGLPREGTGVHQEISKANIPMGGIFRAQERIVDHGSYQTRQEIASIEVIRMNGQRQKLIAPFDGVHGIELDWIFVIDNWQIHSVSKNH